jgi:hypothetical protein
MTRFIRPRYCPRKTSPDRPLKKAHKRCPFRQPRVMAGSLTKKWICSCPSGIRYLYRHGIKGMSKMRQEVLCIA